MSASSSRINRVEDCSDCGEEMFFDQDYRTDTDDPLYCVPCLVDKVKGRCLLAEQAVKVGDLYLADRCYEDAWAYVAKIESVSAQEAK